MFEVTHEPTFHVNSSSNHYFFWSPVREYKDSFGSHFGCDGIVQSTLGKILYAANQASYWAVNEHRRQRKGEPYASLEDQDKVYIEAQKDVNQLFRSFGIPLNTDPNLKDWYEYGIDHQSVIETEFCEDGGVDWDLFKSFFFWLMQPRAGIFLWNDNSWDYGLPPPPKGWKDQVNCSAFWDMIREFDYRVRPFSVEPEGFAAVSKETGYYSIDFRPKEFRVCKVPEAIDMKITDRCSKGCKFCYQSSTKDGAHAKYEKLSFLAKLMGEKGVLQVALGGGEPTNWEEGNLDWTDVVDLFHKNGVLPSFSTGTLNWCQKETEELAATLRKCGGVAFSVTSEQEATDWALKVEGLKSLCGPKGPVFSANIIPEMKTNKELQKIIQILGTAKIHILFLGYKSVGLGNKWLEAREDRINENWMEVIDSAKRYNSILSADTLISEHYPILFHGEDFLRVPEEGQKTLYVDAVTWRTDCHSYSGYGALIDQSQNSEEVWESIIRYFPYAWR